jgi:hypothetical protein
LLTGACRTGQQSTHVCGEHWIGRQHPAYSDAHSGLRIAVGGIDSEVRERRWQRFCIVADSEQT